ncbi:hypothetical protein TL16_g01633 [Triparma laevis f. inornata]|uniref:Uncharacterized protein n=1 Tax=Triparma laevis f. inornata TaxID=1714386 RepID=A0A9W6ZL67_9STRA|nr:hypothetical protein TL16_g01633 [Triparma laevis f. inornata]
MSAFADLDEASKAAIVARQKNKQSKKKKKKKGAPNPAAAPTPAPLPPPPFAAERRTRLTQDEYFGASPGCLFRDPRLPPTPGALDFVMRALDGNDETAEMLGSCNYFQFTVPPSSPNDDALWDPEFYCRLCHAGFFVITADTGPGRSRQPLPELQPFYGVIHWNEFDSVPRVRKVLKKLTPSSSPSSSPPPPLTPLTTTKTL